MAATLPPVRGLLLDLDDTVIATGEAMVKAGTDVVTGIWPDTDRATGRAFARHFFEDASGEFARYTRGEVTFEEMRRRRFEASRAAHRLAVRDDDFDRYEQDYVPAFRDALWAYDDVEPFLRWAAQRALPVGLLTNSGGEPTAAKLAAVGLTGRFACVVTTDTLGFGKPDARVFHHACDLLGVAPAQVLFVGDHAVVDVEGARAAGLPALLLERGLDGTAPASTPVIRSLADIATLLAEPGMTVPKEAGPTT